MKKTFITLFSLLILLSPKLVDALEISESSITIEKGNSKTLTITDLEEGQTVAWSSGDSESVTVSNGVVHGVKKTTSPVVITAVVSEGNEEKGTFNCSVTVTEVEPSPSPSESPDVSPSPSPSPSPTTTPAKIEYSIEITGGELTDKFDMNKKEYTVKVTDLNTFKNDGINVKRSSNDIKYKIPDLGSVKDGSKLTVEINGEKYILIVSLPKTNTLLDKLSVTGYSFNETFNKETTRYTLTIPNDVTEITVNWTKGDDKQSVTTSKLDDLKVGGNSIYVTVKNGNDSTTYTIYVTRSDEEKVEEKKTSIIKNSTSTTGTEIDTSNDPKITSPLHNIIVVLTSLALFITGGIGIYFYIKTSPKRMKKELLKLKNKKEESPIVEIKKEDKKEEIDDNLI